jgi:hypothetical protein
MALTNGLMWLLYFELDYCNRPPVCARRGLGLAKPHARRWGRKNHRAQAVNVLLCLAAAVLSYPRWPFAARTPFWGVGLLWFSPCVPPSPACPLPSPSCSPL